METVRPSSYSESTSGGPGGTNGSFNEANMYDTDDTTSGAFLAASSTSAGGSPWVVTGTIGASSWETRKKFWSSWVLKVKYYWIDSSNFATPGGGHVKLEYTLDGGSNWFVIDGIDQDTTQGTSSSATTSTVFTGGPWVPSPLTNIRVRATCTSNVGDGANPGDGVGFFIYDVRLEGQETTNFFNMF